MNVHKLMDLIQDLPKGPLDVYRKKATFNWKLLKFNLEGEDSIRFQNNLWKLIKNTPIFKKNIFPVSLNEQQRLCHARILTLNNHDINPIQSGLSFNYLFLYDASIPIKMGITHGMVPNSIISLGTEQHGDFLEKLQTNEYIGCFALTEISHGTNAKGIRTTATYNTKLEGFILNTADFEAAKCWAGGLGKTSTHAILYAQLITPDGVNHGLHPFFVPIRDPKTLLPLQGVTVGDMGEKIALNGIDNGFVMFKDYYIPRKCLLNRISDVTKEGKYISSLRNKNKRFGASLGALSIARVTITFISATYLTLALTIAIRYCAVRKQFGPSESEEWSVLQYQAQQGRLFPHLAAAYAIKIFSTKFGDIMINFQLDLFSGNNEDLVANKGMEIHALSSATKPLCSWTARNGIQDCRESCGGHGYLKMTRLGDLRAEHDANCTYEGENNVLLQQASNWLLSQWLNILDGKPAPSPLGTMDFINDTKNILLQKFNHTTIEQTLNPENLLSSLKWLVCYYLTKTFEHTENLKKKGYSSFEVRNESQMFFAHTLSLVYGEHAILKSFTECLEMPNWRVEERNVLRKLCSLYGATVLENRLADLYAGNYASPQSGIDSMLRDGIMTLCKDLLNESVALIDVLAPPDFIVNSPLGMADGKVYEHMQDWIFKNKENLERPLWWKEVVQSKL